MRLLVAGLAGALVLCACSSEPVEPVDPLPPQPPVQVQAPPSQESPEEAPGEPVPEPIANPQDHLVGIWHASPELGSGWSDAYLLGADGQAEFRANQMDCEKRLIGRSGRWSVKSSTLELRFSTEDRLEGGRIVVDETSCASGRTLIEAVEMVVEMESPVVERIELVTMKRAAEPPVPTLTIGGRTFWRLSSDPATYP